MTGYCFRSISLFISLSARLRENGWTDLHEILREGVNDLITFWLIPRNRAMPRCATRGRGLLCFRTPACCVIVGVVYDDDDRVIFYFFKFLFSLSDCFRVNVHYSRVRVLLFQLYTR